MITRDLFNFVISNSSSNNSSHASIRIGLSNLSRQFPRHRSLQVGRAEI